MPKTTENAAAPSFEFFEGNLSVSSSRPQITVRRGGLMVLTQAAVAMLGDGVSHVQLAYDASTGIVGIRSCNEDTAGRYTLRSQKKSPSRLVGGKRFFQHHGLEIAEAKTYAAEDFGDGIVGLRLQADQSESETDPAEAKTPAGREKATAA